jgi:hypothetical protein
MQLPDSISGSMSLMQLCQRWTGLSTVGGVYLNNKPLCSAAGASVHDSGAGAGI